jgi:CRISPR-associated endonuclease/helicase Cas3
MNERTLHVSLWAKLSRDDTGRITGWHSLVVYSADVAAATAALLKQPTINRRLAATAGRDTLDTVTCTRLTALAFLHDIGKANRGFQRRIDPTPPVVGHIDQLAWIYLGDGGVYTDRMRDVLGLERIEAWFAERLPSRSRTGRRRTGLPARALRQ